MCKGFVSFFFSSKLSGVCELRAFGVEYFSLFRRLGFFFRALIVCYVFDGSWFILFFVLRFYFGVGVGLGIRYFFVVFMALVYYDDSGCVACLGR